MSRSISSVPASTEGKSLDGVRPQMAKATLDDQSRSIRLTEVARDALVRHFGSLKAAAIEMAIDQGQLTRELDSGKLNMARLAKCGDEFLAKFAALLAEHTAALSSPKARGFQLLREIDIRVDELRQLLEAVA